MKQSEFTTRVLTPEEGHKLTQADDATELSRRIISDKVYLAPGDSPEAWREITDAEAEALQAEQAAAIEAEVAAMAATLEEEESTRSSQSTQSSLTEDAGAQEDAGSTRSSQSTQSTLIEDAGTAEQEQK